MDQKQLTASVAGAALVAASLFGAVAVAQISGDVRVSGTAVSTTGLVAATDAPPVSVTVAQVTDESIGEIEEYEYEHEESDDD